ncbi:MAG: GNAT family N-acetyltransferase [Paracoccaceae bacterium]
MSLDVRTMIRPDLDWALDLAAAEGWNPGLDDAAAFHAADPDGFLVAALDGAPVASLSIVRFGDGVAFLGLFICAPGHRGRGHGLALWHEGMARLAPAMVGLDGVPAQQANYARSGFVRSHATMRFTGTIAAPAAGATVPLASEHLDEVLALDRDVTGFDRAAFMRDWLTGAESRHARVFLRDGRVVGLGVIRACREGFKIGPLVAPSEAEAEAILLDLAARAEGAPLSLDVPEPNAAAVAMAERHGLAPSFETARMWRGPAPRQDLGRTFGVATLELG